MLVKIILTLIVLALIVGILFYVYLQSGKKTLEVNDVEREYYVHLPSGYSKDKNYPLVIAFHGYGDHPKLFEFYTGFSAKANSEGFIVVYPKGTNDSTERQLSFNGGVCCNPAIRNNVDDIGFASALIDSLLSEYSINSDYVFVTGFSNGGIFTNRLATEIPEKITAIAPVAGTVSGRVTANTDENFRFTKPGTAVPALLIHGTADESIRFGGGMNHDGKVETGSALESFAFWSENNQCTGKTTEIRDEKLGSTQIEHVDCKAENATILYALDDVGHTWPGGRHHVIHNIRGTQLKATDVIWDFFSQYRQ